MAIVSQITAQTVFDASKRGDRVALEIVRDTAHFLGVGISNLINIFNPDTFVIAGGVTQAGDLLFDPLRAEVRRRAFKPSVRCLPNRPWCSAVVSRRRRSRGDFPCSDSRGSLIGSSVFFNTDDTDEHGCHG